MHVLNTVKEIENHLNRLKKQGKTIGFVPTMGALHSGHISLIKASKRVAGATVCSIFVNPTQFNDPKDFEKYPITTGKDTLLLAAAGCDVLFLPPVNEIYPKGTANKSALNFGFLAGTLEGEYRPGHFAGMAQVVERLLRIVKPDFLLMGQKDYQQQLIVGELIKKRRLKVKLLTEPTIREKDGLAMSSRNVRLDKHSRKVAVQISKALKLSKALFKKGKTVSEAQQKGLEHLKKFREIETEYFEIRNARTLKPPKRKTEKLVALAAVNIGGVRLIDNYLV